MSAWGSAWSGGASGAAILRCVGGVVAPDFFQGLDDGVVSTTFQLSAGNCPANPVGEVCRVALNAAFDAPGLTSLKLSIGTAGFPGALLDQLEVSVGGGASSFATRSVDQIGGDPIGQLGAGQPLIATVEASGADLNAITTGEVQIITHVGTARVL